MLNVYMYDIDPEVAQLFMKAVLSNSFPARLIPSNNFLTSHNSQPSPLSSEFGTNKTVKAGSFASIVQTECLSTPFSLHRSNQMSFNTFQSLHSRSAAALKPSTINPETGPPRRAEHLPCPVGPEQLRDGERMRLGRVTTR